MTNVLLPADLEDLIQCGIVVHKGLSHTGRSDVFQAILVEYHRHLEGIDYWYEPSCKKTCLRNSLSMSDINQPAQLQKLVRVMVFKCRR